jgi:hypothetical protein
MPVLREAYVGRFWLTKLFLEYIRRSPTLSQPWEWGRGAGPSEQASWSYMTV